LDARSLFGEGWDTGFPDERGEVMPVRLMIRYQVTDEGVENPLPGIDEARRLQATVAKRAVGPAPAPQPLDLLGAYGMFG
jgi:hypothetical protein